MVDSVRNTPNMGGLTVHDQKKSNVSSGQTSQLSGNESVQTETPSVSVDLSLKGKVLLTISPVNMELVNEIVKKLSR